MALAQAYRGWNRSQVGKALGRQAARLVPGTGLPKLDVVIRLAEVLQWPISEVASFLWEGDSPGPGSEQAADFESLDDAAAQAHRSGQYELMLKLARQAYAVAATADQRARACNRTVGGCDGLGRYTEALQAARRGLQEPGVAPELRCMLQSNLANAYYTLWALVESQSISENLLEYYRQQPPQSARHRKTHAFSHYVCGQTFERLMSIEPQQAQRLAESARHHLQLAFELYERLAVQLDDESLAGIANTCHGGIIEAEVELGLRSASDALAELSAGIERVGAAEHLVGDRLESYGWWCIFGCNIAIRHVAEERALSRYLAVFTRKAAEIADRMNNWALRERVFTMQYTIHQRLLAWTGGEIPLIVDHDDIGALVGTIGRFPTFRETGWSLLRGANALPE